VRHENRNHKADGSQKTIMITGSKDYPAFASDGIVSGGMEVMVTEYAKHIPEGYRFMILAGRKGLPGFEDRGQVSIYRLPILGSGWVQPFTLCLASVLKALTLRKRVDCCLPQTALAALPALALKKLFGIPYIVYTHSFNAEVSHVGNRFFAFLYCVIERLTFHRADGLVTAGELLRDYVMRRYKVPKDRIAVIHSGVGIPDRRPIDQSMLERYGISASDFVVLYLGRLIEENGIFDLIDAVLMLRRRGINLKCLIAGNGDLEPSLRHRIKTGGAEDAVKLVGVIRGDTKDNMLRRCDLLARTSYHEVFPVVYLEAFSYGKPVLATPVGDTPVIARDSQAVRLVETHRPDQVAEAMQELLEKPHLRKEMGERGLRYASSSTWDNQSQKLFDFIDRILAGE
jgi:glycosyltransferase involved in cell wall biosynthesis